MAEIDHGVKLLAHNAGRQLARVAGVACHALEPLESTLQATTERLADRVFRARSGRRQFVLYFEFYTSWNRDIPWDLLLKSSMLSQRERLPTQTVAFILRPRGYKPQHGQFRLAVGDAPTQQLWFHAVPLWEVVPQPWWEQTPALMTLYPLCHHGRKPREAVQHAAQVIEESVTDRIDQADSLCILNVFGELAYPHLDVRSIIGRELMKGSRFYREVLEEGRQQGLSEGELKAKREAILEALQERFGEEAGLSCAAAVNGIEDIVELRSLHRLAVRCKRLDDFRQAVPAPHEDS